MSRPKNAVPSYSKHNSGHGRARWTDAAGVRRERILPGPFDSPESKTAFARLVLEIETAPHRVNRPDPAAIGVNEVLEAYMNHAEKHYRGPDGESTGEVERIGAAVRPLRELFGTATAAEFGPLSLKTLRQRYVKLGWCRRSVNQQIERIKRIFKWAPSRRLVPPAVYHGLATVGGLQRGR